MKQNLLSIIYLFAFSFSASSQITFQKSIGVPNALGPSGRANSIQQTIDGGYIIGGFATVGSTNDVYLSKTNSYGDIIWTKTFGGANIDYGYSAQQTTDGGYIVSGHTQSFPGPQSDIYLIKANGNGDTMWTKTYGGIFLEQCYSVEQTNDGGYIMTGTTIPFAGSNQQVYLIKTDALGDTLWAKAYDDISWSHGFSVRQTTDGGYIVTGNAGSANFDDNIYLLKTDPNGNVMWAKSFGGTVDDFGKAVEQTADGGYVITGYTNSYGAGYNDIFLIKTDSLGNTLWDKIYGNADNNEAYSVVQTIDGGYVLAGRSGFGIYDVYVIKTNATGDTLWTKSYGQPSPFGEEGYSIRQSSDGGYIIGGTKNLSAYLIKTDSTGNSGCNHGNNSITIAAPLIPQINNSPAVTSFPLIVGSPPTIVNSGGAFNTLCSSVGINEIDEVNGFNIFPNPASNIFSISFKKNVLGGNIELTNVLGEKVLIESFLNESKKEINLENISQGIYFVKVFDGEKSYCKKLMVE